MDGDFWTAVSDFMTGVLDVINALLLPVDTTGVVDWTQITAIQTLIWFGLVFLFVGPLFGFIIKMVKAGGR
jgi:hypothetical protein